MSSDKINFLVIKKIVGELDFFKLPGPVLKMLLKIRSIDWRQI